MGPRQLTILRGRTFMVSDGRGNVEVNPAQPSGLFYRDMRHLSRWELRFNGRPLIALAGDVVAHDEAVVFLEEPTGTVYRNPTVSVVRRRWVGDGVTERLEVTSHDVAPLSVQLDLLFDADFADVFEVKDRLAKSGRMYRQVGADHVLLGYRRDGFVRETRISAGEAYYTQESASFRLRLEPGECWRRDIRITVGTGPGDAQAPDLPDRNSGRLDPITGEIPGEMLGGQAPRPVAQPPAPRRPGNHPAPAGGGQDVQADPFEPVAAWLQGTPRLDTDSDDLMRLYRHSLIDLAALRFHPDGADTAALPAAGLPWFMALFGRDSLIVSYQALPFVPELARTTLHTLAALQAHTRDDFRDAEPGKILHELRHGELTYFGQRPQSPYYGSADATPLFLVVLDEYERWSGDTATVRNLETVARKAMRWVEVYGDTDRDGFVEYATRNPVTGLVNQCWKDSWNSIVHPDGTLAALPRATCELQGYAYDARRRVARLAREVWHDPTYAQRLDRDADRLRDRFQEAFWLPDRGFYALALDGRKRPVPTLTSNLGHLLWSGIVPDERVDDVVSHLMGEPLFSGWGVRTLAAGQPAYNPIEYHNGSVWPHDNSLIAAGLARYGRRAEAARIARAVLDSAPHVGYRLPEALVGIPRASSDLPVPYPSACSPQAWASGATLLFIRTVLGLEPTADGVRLDPRLPDGLSRLGLSGIPVRGTRCDAAA
ncbi:MAG TPA: glycogen debranching N-terminal domain-containing protein [Kineosporiaceae bacterium]|nr:glycogen debranching N-terminal domain-containing protein [Kineosporiaceae bacterium]